MKFPFTYEVVVDGVTVAEIDGRLVIEADDDSRFRGVDPEWTVDEVEVDGGGLMADGSIGRRTATLPDDHWLHDRLLADVLTRCRRAIDDAWAAHLRAQRASARRGFFAVPRNDA